jgi:hypothetical protein
VYNYIKGINDPQGLFLVGAEKRHLQWESPGYCGANGETDHQCGRFCFWKELFYKEVQQNNPGR